MRGHDLYMIRLLTTFLVAFLLSLPATAQPMMEDLACDEEFMDAVEAKGWLDGQREIAQNQNLIYKSDSVLEYTCFQQYMERVAVVAAQSFSEATMWGSVTGISDVSTDVALQQVVGLAFISYLQANFPHTYRGGRLDVVSDPGDPRGEGQVLCEAMTYVWEQAKCARFMDKSAFLGEDENNDIDGFYEFTWYRNNAPRQLPRQFASCAPAQINFDLTMPVAYNDKQDLHILPEENPNDDQPYIEDPVLSHLQFILPDASCGESADPEAGPIPTGVRVFLNAQEGDGDYDEHICLNPGCSYDGEKCTRN